MIKRIHDSLAVVQPNQAIDVSSFLFNAAVDTAVSLVATGRHFFRQNTLQDRTKSAKPSKTKRNNDFCNVWPSFRCARLTIRVVSFSSLARRSFSLLGRRFNLFLFTWLTVRFVLVCLFADSIWFACSTIRLACLTMHIDLYYLSKRGASQFFARRFDWFVVPANLI